MKNPGGKTISDLGFSILDSRGEPRIEDPSSEKRLVQKRDRPGGHHQELRERRFKPEWKHEKASGCRLERVSAGAASWLQLLSLVLKPEVLQPEASRFAKETVQPGWPTGRFLSETAVRRRNQN
jgi:hypothetical protein